MPGIPELLVILLIVLVVFGANKLPGIGDALGRSIKNFKRASKVEGEEDDAADTGSKTLPAGATAKQLDKGKDASPRSSDDGEWEEVVVRRKKSSASDV